MLKHPNTRHARARGFSIVELIVVIGIAGLLIGISYPIINSLIRGTQVAGGINTIGMSVDVARQWVGPAAWDADVTGLGPQPQEYSGTAALITPMGEIRIVRNARNAVDQSGDFLEINRINGYEDYAPVDTIFIPDGVGVVGIYRNGSGNAQLLAPPFAIAFDENGHMSFGDSTGRIYYDGDGDDVWNVSNNQRSGYNSEDWTGESGANNDEAIDPESGDERKALPFDGIECVPGVIIYEEDAFKGSGLSFSNGAIPLNATAEAWFKENGTSVFFSPHTGAVLSDEATE